MDEARSQALEGIEEGTVIVALEQTKGRGRQGRVWESLKGNLYLTYITYLDVPLSQAPQLSFVACVAIGEELRAVLPPLHRLTYKWPNDLLLNGKKVGGLLLEALSIPEKRERGYLIGCGLNVKIHPEKARYPATSFQQEGIYVSIEELLPRITTSLQTYITLWQQEGFSPIREVWMQDAINLEKKISFHFQGKIKTGIFKEVDQEGALMLETPEGLQKFSAGEIVEGGTHAEETHASSD